MTFAEYLQTKPQLTVAAAFIPGIIVGDATSGMMPMWCWLAAAVVMMVLYWAMRNKFVHCSTCCIMATTFCIGATIITNANRRLSFPFKEGNPIFYEVVVTSEPKVKGKTLQCDLAVTDIEGKTLKTPVNVKASILRDTINNDWRKLNAGSGIEVVSVMRRPMNYYHDSNFDYVRWLHIHGFTAQTFIYHSNWVSKKVSLEPFSRLEILQLKALQFRARLINQLHINNENEDQQSAVITAMVLGDKHAISKDTKDAYSISGGSHVLALSGLHLSIIYAILTLLIGRWRRRWISQIIVLTAIWMYVVMVGMGSSVVRSAVMLSVYSLCMVTKRDKASINCLAFAAIIMLIANPLCLWDVGFQMSFMAVAAILVYYKPIYYVLPVSNKILKAVWGMMAVSLSAQIGTAPLVAYYFGRFSCYFLLTNFIVVPAATVIIYGTLAVLITSPIQAISGALAKVLNAIAYLLNSAMEWVASLPGASIEGIHISTTQLCFVYIIILCISLVFKHMLKVRDMKKLDAFLKRQGLQSNEQTLS